MSQRVAIQAEGLMKAMGRRTVLRGVDLAVLEGECVVLKGDNGSGKTTLLRCLAGLVRPDAGFVQWFERSPLETKARRLIGMVAHESHLYPHLTLRENLTIAGRLHDLSGADPTGEPLARSRRSRTACGSIAERGIARDATEDVVGASAGARAADPSARRTILWP